jgi:hypothetical protein
MIGLKAEQVMTYTSSLTFGNHFRFQLAANGLAMHRMKHSGIWGIAVVICRFLKL